MYRNTIYLQVVKYGLYIEIQDGTTGIIEIRLLSPGVIIVIFENRFATQRGKSLFKESPYICIKCDPPTMGNLMIPGLGIFYLLGCFVPAMCFFWSVFWWTCWCK